MGYRWKIGWRQLCVLLLIAGVLLGGCSAKPAAVGGDKKDGTQPKSKIRLGTTAGPHEEIAQKVKAIAAKDGLEIEVVAFNDGTEINSATAEKKLDANAFQHNGFFDNNTKARNVKLAKIADTYLMPMAVYSKKIRNAAEIPDGATVSLPGDPSNTARALVLFEKAGWIKLPPNAGVTTSVRDIVENPKKLKFKELDQGMIAPTLGEFDAAAINTHLALLHGLHPAKDGLVVEEAKGNPWVCILVVRPEEKDDPAYQKLIKAYHSDELRQFLLDKYKGAILPGW